MFNQHKKERSIAAQMQPLAVEEDDLAQRIVETSRALDLDPTRSLIVGSAALYLYGILPPMIIDDVSRKHPSVRPGDVDISVSALLFNETFVNYQTPSGALPSNVNMSQYDGQHTLRVKPDNSRLLEADIISRYDGKMELEEQEKRFIAYHKDAPTIPKTDIRVASLDTVYVELKRRSQAADPKAREDFKAMRDYIWNHKN